MTATAIMGIPAQSPSQTMSSREIAELLGKQHANLKISAERLAEKGVIGTLAAQEFTHNGNTYTEYLLNKRDSLILVAQNCPEFTARIVDRWQELEAQQQPQQLSPANFSRMQLIELAMQAEQERIEADRQRQVLALEVQAMAPKVEALERIAKSDGSLCLTDAAKTLQVQPRQLTQILQTKHWIYRRPMGSGWLAYQDRIQSGHLEHKVTTGEKSDGHEWTNTQVRVTAKGLTRLAQVLAEVAQAGVAA